MQSQWKSQHFSVIISNEFCIMCNCSRVEGSEKRTDIWIILNARLYAHRKRLFPHSDKCVYVCHFFAHHYDILLCYNCANLMREPVFRASGSHTHIHTDPEQELLFYLTFHVNGNESHLNDILMTFKFISMRCAQYVPANTILCHHTKVSMAYAIFPLLSTLTLPFQIQPAKWNLEWLWCMKYCISTLICYKLCSSFDIL